MISLPVLVVVSSGSVPMRPTRVRRASWVARLVVNARLSVEGAEKGARAALRRGERRDNIAGDGLEMVLELVLEVLEDLMR
jgi:hypothetical protein